MQAWIYRILGGIGLGMLAASFFILPIQTQSVFLSPDETAFSAIVRQSSFTTFFRIPDDRLSRFPWMHPRSFVTHANAMVPVGFLGFPVLLSVLYSIFGKWILVFFTPLLAVSVAYPLWSFVESWGRRSQYAAVIGWLAFPLVILYANRGLFANLPQVCLAMWSGWLLWKAKHPWFFAGAGVVAGLAIAFRPTEAVWILPWLAVCGVMGEGGLSRFRIRNFSALVFPFFLLLLVMAIVGWKTYGSWFVSGYQLRDPIVSFGTPIPDLSVASSGSETILSVSSVSRLLSLWPFGFHPRNVWFNVRSYFFSYLWVWTLTVISAAVYAWRDVRSRPWILVGAWATAALILMYGQGLYQDHVRPNEVAVGNSFLRYTIPVSVIFAFSLAWMVKVWGKRRMVGYVMIAVCAIGGLWTAILRDDEGLYQNRKELEKYEQIRAVARQNFNTSTCVLSERSDKVFFPDFCAVSPLPPFDRIQALMHAGVPTAFFLRTQTREQVESWQRQGIRLLPVAPFGNETLYRTERIP